LGHRYLLERELGEGGMGMVFFASDQDVKGETFAIKVLKPEIREHLDALEMLREEVRKTRALHHPNIVGVYSLNSDRSGVYMLMEYLEGKTLSALIDDDFGRGMPLIRAWPLIKDIGAALAYAHDHSVIHSDLKPPNVFVTTSGKAVLMDFGIARAVHNRADRFDPGALGALTPAYASCEMLEGRPPDQSDDVYSFACVIYEMLSGKHPFDRRSAVEARAAGLKPAPLAVLTRAQNAALAKGLAYDRAQRAVSVEALLAEFDGAGNGGAPPVVWIAGGIALIAVLGVAAWFVVGRLGEDKSATSPTAGSAGPGSNDVPARIKEMNYRAERAKNLQAVDPSQKAWHQWELDLAAVKKSLDAGDTKGIAALLSGADAALSSAITSGDRFMKIGSLQPEIDDAVKLCHASGGRCSPADFAGEAGRMAYLKPFELDQTEITNRDFAEFATAMGRTTQAERAHGLYDYAGQGAVFRPGESWRTIRDAMTAKGIDAADYPVAGIDFDAAGAFCDWRHRRLPTGDEWEFVARGVKRHIFPWGDEARENHPTPLVPVTEQQPTGRFGNRGLGGSLWEWVSDGTPTQRVLRGASWRDRNPLDQRLAMRRLEDPTHAFVDTGFRCARAVDVWPDPQ
jgi:hypothetical protein